LGHDGRTQCQYHRNQCASNQKAYPRIFHIGSLLGLKISSLFTGEFMKKAYCCVSDLALQAASGLE
jgi:hypothetical protein